MQPTWRWSANLPHPPLPAIFSGYWVCKIQTGQGQFQGKLFYSELNTNYSYPAKAETQVCFLSSGNRTTTSCYSLYSWEKMHVPLFVSFFAVEKIILLLVTFISSCMCMQFLSFLMSSDWWHSLTIIIFSPSSQEMAKILNHPRVYSFLHVPVQSASDNVLSDMKREYCADDFRHVVDFLREKWVHIMNIIKKPCFYRQTFFVK